jgi:hypothetical protein
MSGVKCTPTVRSVAVPAPQQQPPLITIGEILTGLGTVAIGGSLLVGKGLVGSAKLLAKGVAAAGRHLHEEHNRRLASLNVRELSSRLTQAEDTPAVLQALAAMPDLRITAAEYPPIQARMQLLAANHDHRQLALLGQELLENHQAQLRACLRTLAAESFHVIGFQVEPLQHTPDILVAKMPGTTQSITVDIARDANGEVNISLDVEGFHGGACEATTRKWLAEMKRRGAEFDRGEIRRRQVASSRTALRQQVRAQQ